MKCRYGCATQFPTPYDVLKHYRESHAEQYEADLAKRGSRSRRMVVPPGWVLMREDQARAAQANATMADAYATIRSAEAKLEAMRRRDRLQFLCEIVGIDMEKIVAFFGSRELLPEDTFEKGKVQ